MKADKGAAASGFCPPAPLGFSKPKPAAYFKKKKKRKEKEIEEALKESYRQLPPPKKTNKKQTKNPTHTKSKPFSQLPSHLPPTQYRSLFSFFFSFFLKFCLPPLHLGSQGYNCWWVMAGTQRAKPHLWPKGGGNISPYYILNPQTPISWPSLRLPLGEGERAGGPDG